MGTSVVIVIVAGLLVLSVASGMLGLGVAFAAVASVSGSSSEPRWTVTPLAWSASALASERARPVTAYPFASSSSVTAEPIQPEAPVMKMFVMLPPMSVTDINRSR